MADALEGGDPALRPPVHLVESHRMRHVGLFRRVLLLVVRLVEMRGKGLPDPVHLARLEAEARGVADLRTRAEEELPALDPVADDAELARLVVEEAVHVADDDLVDVQEEGRSCEVAAAVLEKRELRVDGRPVLAPRLESLRLRRNRTHLNALGEPFRLVGEADEAERTPQVALHARIETVHVERRIGRAPFQTDDVDMFG